MTAAASTRADALGAGVGPREGEQAVDEIAQAVGLAQRRIAVVARRKALEPQPERGQRRPQLVRGVGDELALRAQEPRRASRRSR